MAEVKDYFTDAGTLDRQEFGNLFASSIHLHDDTACGRATLLQCLDTRYWPSPMTGGACTHHCHPGYVAYTNIAAKTTSSPREAAATTGGQFGGGSCSRPMKNK